MAKTPRFTLVPQQIRRLPQPWNDSPWPVGQGPRYWTPERIAELAKQNELLRVERKAKP